MVAIIITQAASIKPMAAPCTRSLHLELYSIGIDIEAENKITAIKIMLNYALYFLFHRGNIIFFIQNSVFLQPLKFEVEHIDVQGI